MGPMSDEFSDLSDEEMVRMYMGDTIERTVQGETLGVEMDSERVELTKAQADIIVDALSVAQYENDKLTEAARRTQTRLIDRFGLEK